MRISDWSSDVCSSDLAELAVQAGRAWQRAERMDRAKGAFDRAVGLDPDSVEALAERGWTSANLEDYRSAVADFTAALALSPGDPVLLRRRAAAHRFLGDYDEALADIGQAQIGRAHV